MKIIQKNDYLIKITLIYFLIFISSQRVFAQQDSLNFTNNKWFSENCTVQKLFDQESNTSYYVLRIKNKDANGQVNKLHMGLADSSNGDTGTDFSRNKGTEVAINGSMGLKNLPDGKRQPVGIQIIDGVIKQELPTKTYTLGIKKDNQLVAYRPGTSASDILKDGSHTALTAFAPLIIDHQDAPDDIYKVTNNLIVKHPRQVIGQFENNDLLFFSCGGRGFDGDGMTAKEMMRILKGLGVKFAFNLDGGGSTSTMIKTRNINKKIDENGTIERPRPNFLYIRKN